MERWEAYARVYGAQTEPCRQVDLAAASGGVIDPEGVCYALSCDWLGNGGSLRTAKQMWRTRDSRRRAIAAVQSGMYDPQERLREYGLSLSGAAFDGTIDGQSDAWFHYMTRLKGLNYISLRGGTPGHAVGFRYLSGVNFVTFRFFDPNYGQFSFAGENALGRAKGFVGDMALGYYPALAPAVRILRCNLPNNNINTATD